MLNLEKIGAFLVALIVFYALWFIYAKLAYREVRPDAKGRVTLKPGLVSILMGLFSIILACLFAYMTIDAIMNPAEGWLFFLLLGTPLTALMLFSALITLWTRVRVSTDSLDYRGLRGWESFSWREINSVDAHSGLGPRINTLAQRKLYFWPYGYGLDEVRNIFAEYDKPFSVA